MKHTKHLLVLWAALLLGAGNAWGADMCIDFESATTAYSDWTFTNMTSQQTGTITAKGGTYYGTTGGKATASITTKTAIATPTSITFYVSKQSSNTKSSSWKVQVSSDNSTWNDVKTQSATSMSQGTWVEVTQDLSSYSNVYVRVYYTGATAVRNIDDLCLTSGSTGTTLYLGLFLAAFVAVRACVRRVECLYATFHHIIMSKIDFRSVHFAKECFVCFFLFSVHFFCLTKRNERILRLSENKRKLFSIC